MDTVKRVIVIKGTILFLAYYKFLSGMNVHFIK